MACFYKNRKLAQTFLSFCFEKSFSHYCVNSSNSLCPKKLLNNMNEQNPLSSYIQRHFHNEKQSSNKFTDNIVVCVEGNIGCGKTTLLNYFQNAGGCEVIAEPVEKWRNIEGYNALELMYQDPTRWSMALQTYVQLTMLQSHTKPMTQKVRLMERSIFSAKYCFLDNLLATGRIPELEYIILNEWFEWIVQSQNVKVDLIVYLRTDPEVLHKRIMTRCREEEKSIPLEYLKSLHTLHEDWLVHKKHPCPEVLVLDANQTLEQMEKVYASHKSHILRKSVSEKQSSSV